MQMFNFWSQREDILKEVHNIKRQNLKLGQCTMQKYGKVLKFKNLLQ